MSETCTIHEKVRDGYAPHRGDCGDTLCRECGCCIHCAPGVACGCRSCGCSGYDPKETELVDMGDGLPVAPTYASLTAQRDAARNLTVALEAQLARVAALAEKWRYKGEFGWGAWQEGHGPDPEGYVLDQVSSEIRQALDADA